MNWLERTELLVGSKKLGQLKKCHVLVIGLGGVGAYAAEMICRAGIGEMTIVDGDIIEESNRNRQLIALKSNEGKFKAEVMANRLLDINPELKLKVINDYLKGDKIEKLLKNNTYDYIIDAIDTLSPKVYILYNSIENGYRVISSMGSGGKTDPLKIQVSDISESYNCHLAKMIRKRLSRLGIKKGIKVVFSPEEISPEAVRVEEGQNKKSVVGTLSYIPPVFGCVIASEVIRDLMEL